MLFDNELQIGCTFKMEKFDSDNLVTYEGPEFHNSLLNVGFAALYNTAFTQMLGCINLGSSDAPVEVTQTGLIGYLYSSSSIFNSQVIHTIKNFPKCYFERKVVFQFPVGTCTGTFRELGVSQAHNAEYLNRQLIKDVNGNPMTLVVAADEGLRITVAARMYISPNDSLFSQVYELDLKGAVVGDITFSNGVTTKTLTYEQISVYTELQYQLQLWLGAPTVYFTDLSENNTSYIYGFKYNSQSMNITIQSHTLSGGSGAPTLLEVMPFTPPQLRSFILTNSTTSETKEIFYKTRMPLTWETTTDAHRGTIQAPLHWWESGYWYSPLWRYGFGQVWGVINGSAGTTQTLVTPFDASLGYLETKLYFAAGALGIGDQTLNSFGTAWDGAMWNIFDLDQTITINDVEEISSTFRFNFGRYTP